jgi:hypothetical protein
MSTSSDVPQYVSPQVQFCLSSSKIANYSFAWPLCFVIWGIQVSVGLFFDRSMRPSTLGSSKSIPVRCSWSLTFHMHLSI